MAVIRLDICGWVLVTGEKQDILIPKKINIGIVMSGFLSCILADKVLNLWYTSYQDQADAGRF
jgi:hypothetical protein